LTSEAFRGMSGASGSVGWDIKLIAGQCSQDADAIAVLARVVLLRAVLQSGLIEEWRNGDRPHDVVFETLATFPLPGGIQSFRPEEFTDALR
jgi:hypothetical protein